jgi:hypothetical protein
MIIACKCEKCGHIFMDADDDLCLEIDFKDKKITFLCRNPKCRFENVMDMSTWQQESRKSPLPRIGIM